MDNTIIADNGIEIYEHDILLYLDQYVNDKQIVDLSKVTQGKWNAVLMYINKNVFKGHRERLMSDYNKSAYDEYKVNAICDIYINLCYEYDKEISMNGFSFLTGIHIDTLYSWGNEEYRGVEYYDNNGVRIGNIALWKVNHPNDDYVMQSGSTCSEIFKKLIRNNEESLSDKLISGGLNPMKILPALNRRHNWNMPGSNREGGEVRPSIEQIERKYLADSATKDVNTQLPDADFLKQFTDMTDNSMCRDVQQSKHHIYC